MVGGTTNLKGFTTIEAGTSITNTTNANDSSSGALTVAGGIGVIKDSHLGEMSPFMEHSKVRILQIQQQVVQVQ